MQKIMGAMARVPFTAFRKNSMAVKPLYPWIDVNRKYSKKNGIKIRIEIIRKNKSSAPIRTSGLMGSDGQVGR
jgi:hypothetical protein